MTQYPLTWDLDSIFNGGSDSPELHQKLNELSQQLTQLKQCIHKDQKEALITEFATWWELADAIQKGLSETTNFLVACQSENVHDTTAKINLERVQKLTLTFNNLFTLITKQLATLSALEWEQLITSDYVKQHELIFSLTEWKTQGAQRKTEEEEAIIHALSLDGIHAWSAHYDTLVGQLTITVPNEEGVQETLSMGQAYNKMMADPDPCVRQRLFELWEQTWQEQAPLFADTLNHLVGFRLTDQKIHDVNHFLTPALEDNRMSQKTLNALWKAISQRKAPLIQYMQRKAKLLGKEQLDWQDQEAPLPLTAEQKTIPFDEAALFIERHFASISPKMAQFAKKAFERGWIEAEDRPGKRPGGYCTDFPERKETRIFMTYSGAMNEVTTLAHELGHAFHSELLWDLPYVRQRYAMNVAETASTFAELVTMDAVIQEAKTPEEQLSYLDTKLQNALAMFMNIHARFIFETNFYEQRKQQFIPPEQISKLMLAAQKEAFQDSLASYHPHFWASKLHFYIDELSFYNFPYTFGYLFSIGIYQLAKEDPETFEDRYIALLKDTASMSTEDLARKHLNVDLTQTEFWHQAIDQVERDVRQFLELSEALI